MQPNQTQIYERLNEIFNDVFDRNDIVTSDATTAQDIPEWDSLSHINLIISIESEFGFKFPMGQVVKMKNVGEMVTIIEQRATK